MKLLYLEGETGEWNKLVTLDINPDHKPDVVWDLTRIPLPFEDNTCDSIHAYDVLEHLGQQGDYKSFFASFSEFWRILRPDGFLYGISPAQHSRWAWGDPGHTRIISRECLAFLDQRIYVQVGESPLTDYRFCYRADFEPACFKDDDERFAYVIKAIKPSRIAGK